MHDIKYITLNDASYPVRIDGEGSVPCLSMGIGLLLQKTFSSHFRKRFKIYSSDLYWARGGSVDLEVLDIEMICRDVIETAKQLGLEQYYLIGHSVFGGLAVEVAKYQPEGLAGVIGIGATPGWNEFIINFKNEYFDQHASTTKKQRFASLQAEYNQEKLPTDSLVSVAAYYAESPKYFARNVTYADMQELWSGIDCDDDAINHLFADLLPMYDFNQHVDRIQVPVLVAGGQMDYDSVPLEIWPQFNKPRNFTLLDCGPVGHWPHWEAPQVFDAGVDCWLNSIKN